MCSSCTELLKSKECFGEDYFVMALEACIFFSPPEQSTAHNLLSSVLIFPFLGLGSVWSEAVIVFDKRLPATRHKQLCLSSR